MSWMHAFKPRTWVQVTYGEDLALNAKCAFAYGLRCGFSICLVLLMALPSPNLSSSNLVRLVAYDKILADAHLSLVAKSVPGNVEPQGVTM